MRPCSALASAFDADPIGSNGNVALLGIVVKQNAPGPVVAGTAN
jgi:hypothetical protein